jgi:hypothetical protein
MTTSIRMAAIGACAALALWIPAADAADAPGAKPGDASMSCEQIAAELAPYAQSMKPTLEAVASLQAQQFERGRQLYEQRKKEHEAVAAMASVGAVDPTGAAKRAAQAAAIAQAAKERRENEAEINSPLAREADAQRAQLVAQGQQMQDNARIQRLMELGKEKGCSRR